MLVVIVISQNLGFTSRQRAESLRLPVNFEAELLSH